MRRALVVLLGVCLLSLMSAQVYSATVNLVIATGGTAGTYYPLGGAMAQIFNDKVKGVNVTAQSTGASAENLRLIERREADLALVQNDTADYAYNGTEVFKGQKLQGFRVIAALYPETLQIVVSGDSNIKSVPDLKGKRVSVGAPGSGTEVCARQLLAFYGITYKDISPHFLSFAESADQFKDKHIDAFFVLAGTPTAALQDVAAMHKIRLLNIPDDVYGKLKAKYPFFTHITIPAGTYMHQADPVKSVAVQAILIARSDLDEDLVYNLTKALFENLGDLAAAHAKGKEVRLANALNGVSTPLHPGAERYYREKGILK
ncbi:MAG TPA: TAXI family TRAP transporter solute-binding subunit [Firmicutes bacterium]|nr:TAXI family TRAP transporter solute-binding subunit [Bacillota bacterium]